MRKFLLITVFAVALIGCSKNSPVDSLSGTDNSAALDKSVVFNAHTMYRMVAKLDVEETEGVKHDSLRNHHMLDSLRVYLSLTDEQYAKLVIAGKTFFNRLIEIRNLAEKDPTITRASIRALIDEARAKFIASVKEILTADQLALLEDWIFLCWNRPGPPFGGGPGHHGGPHDSTCTHPDSLGHRH